jgi:hypothetical protein
MMAMNQMGAQDPYGLQGSFLDQPLLAQDFDEEIEQVRKAAELLESKPSLTVKTAFGKTGMT